MEEPADRIWDARTLRATCDPLPFPPPWRLATGTHVTWSGDYPSGWSSVLFRQEVERRGGSYSAVLGKENKEKSVLLVGKGARESRIARARRHRIPVLEGARVLHMWAQSLPEALRPMKGNDLLGGPVQRAWKSARLWWDQWASAPADTPRGLLVTGPAGTGKTSFMHALAREAGAHVLEVNTNTDRSVRGFQSVLEAIRTRSLWEKNRPTVLLLDDLDQMGSEGGGVRWSQILQTTRIRILATAREVAYPHMTSLKLQVLSLPPMSEADQMQLIDRAERAGMDPVPAQRRKELVHGTGGDARKLLEDLQWEGPVVEKSQVQRNLFQLGEKLFEADQAETLRELAFEDPSLTPLLVHENYLDRFRGSLESLANVAAAFSEADRVGRQVHGGQQWDLWPYEMELAVVQPLRLLAENGRFSRLRFPAHLGKLSRTTGRRNRLLELGQANAYPREGRDAFRSDTLPGLWNVWAHLPAAEIVCELQARGWKREHLDILQEMHEDAGGTLRLASKTKAAVTRAMDHRAKKVQKVKFRSAES